MLKRSVTFFQLQRMSLTSNFIRKKTPGSNANNFSLSDSIPEQGAWNTSYTLWWCQWGGHGAELVCVTELAVGLRWCVTEVAVGWGALSLRWPWAEVSVRELVADCLSVSLCRELEAPHGQIHEGGRAAAPCHPWACAVLRGLWRPRLQVWEPHALGPARAGHHGPLLLLVSSSTLHNGWPFKNQLLGVKYNHILIWN